MKTKILLPFLVLTLMICTLLMFLLYHVSERMLSRENPFIRKFIPGMAEEIAEIDLNFNTYYFAGGDESKFFLGNLKAFQRVTIIDSSLGHTEAVDVDFPKTSGKYTSLRLSVNEPNFFYSDGTVPEILVGSTKDWKLSVTFVAPDFFNKAIMVSSGRSITRSIDVEKGQSSLNLLDLQKGKRWKRDNLLKKQVDGIFDCDGDMHFEPKLNLFIYVYRYRNSYVMTDGNLKLIRNLSTIDTNSIAKIKVATSSQTGYSQFSSPPVIVNKASTICRNLLFVQSINQGRFETKEMSKEATTVDVYDVLSGDYIGSFYVHNRNNQKMKAFYVHGNALYAMIGANIIKYRLGKSITSRYVSTTYMAKYQGNDRKPETE